MVVKHHENKKNARNQEVKKTGHDRSNGKYFPGKVYLGDEITIVDKTWNCKGQGGCKNDQGNNEQYEKLIRSAVSLDVQESSKRQPEISTSKTRA